MHDKTVAELSADLAAGIYSSEELTRALLDRVTRLGPGLNAFVTVTEERALAAARAADERRRAGRGGALNGVPVAHKDGFCTAGGKTSCGARMLDNFVAPYESTATARLAGAGMVMLGKTNMDEFAMGSSNENSWYGAVRNPWDGARVPGGSSGGSAAAVAARLAPAATGTDTGGSIRQPASFCGLTGIKPTYGRVSRYGMIAFASSLDQAGLLTRSAADAALLLEAMAGFDPLDSTSAERPVPRYAGTLDEPLRGLKVGLPRQYFGDGLDCGVGRALEAALAQCRALGVEMRELDLPNTALAVPVYYVVAPAECSSNLSRFDGVRFGHRCEHPRDLEDLYRRSRAEGFGAEVRRRVMIGTYALSAGYYDAYYLKAQQVRRLISDDFRRAFEQVDVLMAPTAPTVAFRVGEKTRDSVSMYLQDVYTVPASLSGLPAMAVPAGQHDGLPVGLQLIGNYFEEARLLNVAHQFQQASDWHARVPPGFA